MNAVQKQALLRVPPFPGASFQDFVAVDGTPAKMTDAAVDSAIDLMRDLKVGGSYWGAQPELPEGPYVLIRIGDAGERSRVVDGLRDQIKVLAPDGADPWHLLSGASSVVIDDDDGLALIAAITGVELRCVGHDPFASLPLNSNEELRKMVRDRISARYHDPFTGEPVNANAIIRLCGFWRQLIDSNRDISGALGFAFWKRGTVAPLLWDGSEVNFNAKGVDTTTQGKIAIWKSRTPAALLQQFESLDDCLIEVEDGFIRSAGLGADCVPPLSIVVDRLGVHFDPSRPSDLENLIQNGSFGSDLVERAHILRELIVASGVGKYGAGGGPSIKKAPGRRTILVPGQVEDDRALVCGGGSVEGNLDLLRRVRAEAPDAYIIYKPHPDIEAGHRVGAIPEADCLKVADEIVRDGSISGLLDAVDEVHVNTSLAGFEALLRAKPVTTHGVPFYAGWGLTRDLGDVPSRRSAVRTIDELVAAVLLLYPRYLDPVTGLPCPPEILVRRIAEGGTKAGSSVVVQMRRVQGRLKKRLAGLGLAR